MGAPPFISLPEEEFRHLLHALANKTAIVGSNLSVVRGGRVFKSQEDALNDAYAASQDVDDLVRALQRLAGMR